jgi:hypothetical protein
MKKPSLGLSSRSSFHRYHECIRYAQEKKYQGIEWYLDFFRLPAWKGLRDQFFNTLRESGLLFSFHAPTNDVEPALKDRIHSTVALDYLKMYRFILGRASSSRCLLKESLSYRSDFLGFQAFLTTLLQMESSIYSTQIKLLCVELNPRTSMTFSYALTSDRKTQETPEKIPIPGVFN